MKILGIETSCDDTAIAILEIENLPQSEFRFSPKVKFQIHSNVVSSQSKLQAKYGGIWPSLAKREHQKNLPIVFKKATKELKLSEIDLIGVTIGPGLEPCLWQGINFAKDLAQKLKRPLIPVNHIEAHILANFISSGFSFLSSKFQRLFPAICLVVSGGHTQLILMKKIGNYKILGETRDDAAGECFDKIARILGLGYPGGPAIAQEAARLKSKTSNLKFKINLPRPMIYQKNYDFSFSGLKTAVLYDWKSRSEKIRKSKEYIRKMATEAQQAIIDVLIYKTLRASKNYQAKTIILGGGVAANEELRKQFKLIIKRQSSNVKFLVPPKNFSVDNAAMVSLAAYFHYLKEKTKNWKEIEANANLKIESYVK